MKKSKKDEKAQVLDNSCEPISGLPETAFDMVNRYGTYEIQATAHTQNQYPCIAQGYNPKIRQKDGENRHPNR